jgi:hypothetical protein
MTDKFFLTLSSDSPCEFKELNKPSKFRVHLGHVIDLLGKFEVSLVQLFYPATIPNISSDTCYVQRITSGAVYKAIKCFIENGNQYCMALADEINDVEDSSTDKYAVKSAYFHSVDDFLFEFNEKMIGIMECEIVGDKAKIRCSPNADDVENAVYKLSPTLERILGFTRNSLFKPGFVYPASGTIDLRRGLTPILTVCSDIIADQIINNGHERVLRMVHVSPENYSYGVIRQETFSKLIFLPVIKKHVEYIDIYIKDESGNLASFEHGSLKLVLLFKRVGNE